MKCRDCCHRGWGDDEGTPVYGFCIMRGSCPDPDIERSCPDFEHKAVYIATSLHPVSREMVERVWPGCVVCKNAKYVTGAVSAVAPHDAHHEIETNAEGDFDFCPSCGRPITDEAVEIKLKELEALKDD